MGTKKIIAIVTVILALTVAAVYRLSLVAPVERVLPAPTGPYAVGRTVFRWIDQDRPEVLSTRPGDKREVAVWLWYPASPQPGLETAPYVDELDALAGPLTRRELSLVRNVKTHSVADAELAPEPATYPVLLFSPGDATVPALYTSFSEDLASHGYVVAVLGHPYDDAAALLSDGRVVGHAPRPDGGEELLAYERERVSVRVQDVEFVERQLGTLNEGAIESVFRGHLDLGRIGVLGHSVGGMIAAQACMDDAGILACANMDGVVYAMPVYPDDEGRGPSQPFMFMGKPFPAMSGESPADAQRRLSALYSSGNDLLDDGQHGRSYRVTITGATHETFSDEEILRADEDQNEDEGEVERERPRQLLGFARAYLLAFFDENLRDSSPALLDAAPADSAIRVEVFAPQ